MNIEIEVDDSTSTHYVDFEWTMAVSLGADSCVPLFGLTVVVCVCHGPV